MQSKSTTQVIIDDPDDTSGGPLTANELADPRYRGMNRKQRRHAIAHERRAFKNRGGRS
jgi:hypothetical protein